jgi:DnaA-homolog protein
MNQQQIPLALKPPRRPGFDNFIAGSNSAVVETLAHGLESGHWYFLGGPSGSGRSHLLSACFAECHRAACPVSFVSLSVPEQLELLDHAGGEWVMVDDIDVLAGDRGAEIRLFNALNRWRDERTGVVMSGAGRDRFELPDLRSRLGQATRLTLKPLEESDLSRLIQRLAADHEVALGRGAVDYLLHRIPRNPAAIARLMDQLATRALSERRTISVPLAREVMTGEAESGGL